MATTDENKSTDTAAKPSPAPKASTARGADDARSKAADADTARATGARTGGTTEAQQDEYAARGVNPALDNRTGRQAPRHRGPKPQQFPGPEVGHIAEHAAVNGDAFRDAFGEPDGDEVGAKSEGPHGLGPEGVTVGDATGAPVDSA